MTTPRPLGWSGLGGQFLADLLDAGEAFSGATNRTIHLGQRTRGTGWQKRFRSRFSVRLRLLGQCGQGPFLEKKPPQSAKVIEDPPASVHVELEPG